MRFTRCDIDNFSAPCPKGAIIGQRQGSIGFQPVRCWQRAAQPWGREQLCGAALALVSGAGGAAGVRGAAAAVSGGDVSVTCQCWKRVAALQIGGLRSWEVRFRAAAVRQNATAPGGMSGQLEPHQIASGSGGRCPQIASTSCLCVWLRPLHGLMRNMPWGTTRRSHLTRWRGTSCSSSRRGLYRRSRKALSWAVELGACALLVAGVWRRRARWRGGGRVSFDCAAWFVHALYAHLRLSIGSCAFV